MNRSAVARLEVIPLREAFAHEAYHFTTWLEQHINALAERLGIEDLSVIEREKSVGSFKLDLECEDSEGQRVIIENQLEASDHDHLGKLLTYLVNLDATTAVWITSDPRPEHQRVIDWLNESTPADIAFYFVKVEAVRIADSPYAPLFTVLARPDEQSKKIGERKKEWAERHHQRMDFWEQLLNKSRGRTKLFANVSPTKDFWLATGAGRSGIAFTYLIWRKGAGFELYISQDTAEKNKAIFDALHAQKEAVEEEFGGPLEWQRLDDKKASRIRKRYTTGGLADPSSWPELQEAMIDGMICFVKALKPRLMRLDI